MSELEVLRDNLAKIYDYISGGKVSKPEVNAEKVIAMFEDQLQNAFEDGYSDGHDDAY